jgi:hypothetical protein
MQPIYICTNEIFLGNPFFFWLQTKIFFAFTEITDPQFHSIYLDLRPTEMRVLSFSDAAAGLVGCPSCNLQAYLPS